MPTPMNPDEVIAIVVDARRRNLQALIDRDYGGSQARFIEATKIAASEVSGLLRNKHFGEKKARAIELAAGVPYQYLDRVFPEQRGPRMIAGEPDVGDQVAAVVRTMSPAGQWIALGRVQELAHQYPATKPNHSS